MGDFSFESPPSEVNLRVAFLFVEVADVFLAADGALIEVDKRDIGYLFLLALIEVILNHLFLDTQSVFHDNSVFYGPQFLLYFYPVQTNGVVEAARRQTHLFAAALKHEGPRLHFLVSVVCLKLNICLVVERNCVDSISYLL
jgi:hypothetical protein